MGEGDGARVAFDDASTSERDEILLEPKHSIFLSHSGVQKSFVDQLCLDIERHDRYPFFDKRRDSLSIGCKFPKRIFEAIKQCQVAVVVLSEEFFSLTKWPLLELAALVKRQTKDPKLIIMPVFLGLSRAQCRLKLNHERWMGVWQGWAETETDKSIDLREWQAALEVFGPTNGISLNEMRDEVKCRAEIVQAVCKEVLPRTRWDVSHVQGRSHLSMAIRAEIDGIQVSRGCGARKLGVYGVGGIGKTTICKVLCNDYFDEFEGKVCHIEFGVANKLSILQEIVRRFTETSQKVMKGFSEDECKDRIKKGLKEKVFLAIDNVSPTHQTIVEAKELLKMEFLPGSIVIVTARSLSQLQNLNVEECMEMPELNESDARSLFLYHAGPSLNLDFGDERFENILKQCLQRCYCEKGDHSKSGHYHPLALKVLGGQLGSDPREWIDKLNELDPYNPNDEKDHPVFSIIGKSFEMLREEGQFIFMDVAIYFPKEFWRYSHKRCNVFKWLSMVHGISLVDMKRKLEGLKSKSLLENVGDGTEPVGMHDLWREFAMKKSKGGQFDPRPWIYETVYGRDHPKRNELILPKRGRWKNLQRLCLAGDDRVEGCPMEEIDLGCYSDLTVLKLGNVYTDTGMLNVSALTQLRSLEIVYPRPQSLNIHGLNCLKDLVFFHCEADDIRMGSVHEESGDLTRLPSWPTTPDFSNLNRLRDLSLLGCKKADSIAGLSSDMTNLKRLQICGCSSLRRCPGLGDLVALEELNLSKCSKLEELPNLGRLKHLLKLDISWCRSIKVVPGLGGLVSLQEFTADSCWKLAELPEMCKLVNLQRLHVDWCGSMEAIPGLSDLVGLEVLRVSSGWLEGCHDLQKLTKLESVGVNGWGADGLPCLLDLVNLKGLEIVQAGELTGLLDLTRIERLCLVVCNFERLPDLHKLSKLEKLEIRGYGSLREWKICSGLRLFGVDLHVAGTFPRLKILDLWEVALSELPDLSSFPQLSELTITGCEELTRLTSSAPLTALKRLEISGCSSLRALPDVSHLVSLSAFELEDCGELRLAAHEMEKLETMCPGLELDQSHLSDMELEHDHDERDAKRLKVFEFI